MTITYRRGIRRMTDIAPATMRFVRAEIERAAYDIEDYAKDLVPVRTGFLRDSIHVEPRGEVSLQIRADAPYAAYVEYGTRYMHAQPYMTPAVEGIWPDVAKRCKDAIERGLS